MQERRSLTGSEESKPTKNDGFQLLQVKYSATSTAIRHLFVKQFTLLHHKNTSEDKPENRTLLVINVPPFVTEHHMRYLFEKRCGKIARIFLQEKPSLSTATSIFNQMQTLSGGDQEEEMDSEPLVLESVSKFFGPSDQLMSYKVCYVVFEKPNSLTKALRMASDTSDKSAYCLKPSDDETLPEGLIRENFFTGIKLWQKQYNDSIVAPYQAKKVAEAYLEAYKKRAEEHATKEKELAEMGPDKEGWVTVNRKQRRDRQALVSNQFLDQKIKDKYTDRARKRHVDEVTFEESVNKSMLETGKKKGKGGKFKVDFLSDKQN